MKIAHRDPTFTGNVVEAAAEFDFRDGVAEVADDLSPAQLAGIAVLGWFEVEDVADPEPEPDVVPEEKPKGSRSRRPREIGENVPDDEMEIPAPEIG